MCFSRAQPFFYSFPAAKWFSHAFHECARKHTHTQLSSAAHQPTTTAWKKKQQRTANTNEERHIKHSTLNVPPFGNRRPNRMSTFCMFFFFRFRFVLLTQMLWKMLADEMPGQIKMYKFFLNEMNRLPFDCVKSDKEEEWVLLFHCRFGTFSSEKNWPNWFQSVLHKTKINWK